MVGILGMSIGMSAIALGVVAYLFKNKIPFMRGFSKIAAAAIVGIASFLIMGGSFGAFSTASAAGTTGTGNPYAISIDRLDFANQDWAVNVSTDDDFYTNSDTVVTLYIADADLVDDEYIRGNLSIQRVGSGEAGSIDVKVCSADFTKSGTTYNLVSKDTNSKVEMYIAGAGTRDANCVVAKVDFAAGTSSATKEIKFKQDEAAEDILATKEAAPSLIATVGAKTATVALIAND